MQRRLLLPSLLLAVAIAATACGSAPAAPDLGAAASAADEVAGSASEGGEPIDLADLTLADLDGSWSVVAGDASTIDEGTFVGFRVDEELRNIGSTTAVGRTPAVSGELTIADGSLTAVDVVADLTQLASDSSNRDRAIRSNGIETNDFPEATFTLTEPIELSESAASGEAFAAAATGDLTIHGVTNPVTFDLEAQLVNGSTIIVVAQIEIVMSDYGVTPPQLGPVLSISDEGIAEFQLQFGR